MGEVIDFLTETNKKIGSHVCYAQWPLQTELLAPNIFKKTKVNSLQKEHTRPFHFD